MEKFRILLIEDERELAAIVSEILEDHGYAVETADSAAAAFEKMGKNAFHLIVLDINLPDSDGFAVCREIRRNSDVPIIFASARTGENEKITGLDIGGDDYIPKPFSSNVLLAHINASLRRAYGFGKAADAVRFGNIEVDFSSRSVRRDSKTVQLSLREFDLLACLCRSINTAVTKEKLLSDVWGIYSETDPSTLTVHIRWLREKLEDDPQNPQYIRTVYKVGYMLCDGTVKKESED